MNGTGPSPEELERRRQLLRNLSASVKGPGTVKFEGFAEDFRMRIIGTTPVSNVMVGLDGVSANMQPFRDRIAELRVFVDDVICEGDRCVKIAHSEGRMADGRPYRNEYATVYRFENDLVVEGVEYLDTALLQAVFDEPTSE